MYQFIFVSICVQSNICISLRPVQNAAPTTQSEPRHSLENDDKLPFLLHLLLLLQDVPMTLCLLLVTHASHLFDFLHAGDLPPCQPHHPVQPCRDLPCPERRHVQRLHRLEGKWRGTQASTRKLLILKRSGNMPHSSPRFLC